ncbi:MAG: 3',5'-cyclic adenosine monophosphate phosphodiesterase CpdA [Alphaproteobacteria bacterium MarineAlpha3_Bin5]|nr:hypothetical protein [Magnetovibrio sp.]PPR79404.1 MAG: 3',5'-cyclic adenosine monophosphate phosphodiesterase CpdA [Alphaproteobacteria bacterium MarineAlpha3_Bin5]|tara:strand:- start:25 stop:798 length:774 start_codon:yes stop_codon:yes gene_type:complete
MIIAQLTDTHILESKTESQSAAEQRISDLKRCILDIKNLPAKPDVVIHTGDIAHTADRKEYQVALELLKILETPVFVVPGNRDSRSNIRQVFSCSNYITGNRSEPIIYAINNFEVRLIGVDSISPGSNKGYFCPEHLSTLDRLLSSFPEKPTAIFMHHPPIPIETGETNRVEFITKEAGDEFVSMILKHKQVIRVFCGHSHRAYLEKVGKIEFSTVPSIASDLRLGKYPERMEGVPVYQIHEFNPSSNFVSHTRLLV